MQVINTLQKGGLGGKQRKNLNKVLKEKARKIPDKLINIKSF